MATIKITDDRQGATYRTGVNGRLFDLPLNQELNVDDALVDHLKGIGARFDEVDAKRAGSSKEGSGDDLVRAIGPHDVVHAGTVAKGLNDRPLLAGDQPGDVTESGGVAYSSGLATGGNIRDDAEISDIRVAAERKAPQRAPAAEIAGEGEGGTPTAEGQGFEPTHKYSAEEKKAGADKAKAAKAKK